MDHAKQSEAKSCDGSRRCARGLEFDLRHTAAASSALTRQARAGSGRVTAELSGVYWRDTIASRAGSGRFEAATRCEEKSELLVSCGHEPMLGGLTQPSFFGLECCLVLTGYWLPLGCHGNF